MSRSAQRLADFQAAFGRDTIDLVELRRLVSSGLPDGAAAKGFRSLSWKLLLGYLPTRRAAWPDVLNAQRANFRSFYREFLGPNMSISPFVMGKSTQNTAGAPVVAGDAAATPSERSATPVEPVPPPIVLTAADLKLQEEIRKDAIRTLANMHFYNSHDFSISNRQIALERILYIFGKLNAALRYVQGIESLL